MNRSPRASVEAPALLPAVLLRIGIVALGATAFLLAPLPLAWVAFGLAVVGAAVPRSIGCWGSAAIIVLAQLLHPVAVFDARPFAVLLIVHVMHVMGALSLVIDWRGSVEARALAPAGRRLLAIQVPAAALLAVLLAFGEWHLPPVIASAVALVAACAAAATILFVTVPRGRSVR